MNWQKKNQFHRRKVLNFEESFWEFDLITLSGDCIAQKISFDCIDNILAIFPASDNYDTIEWK